ncbi:MAG: hypothetical protein ABW034_24095 [Steroidobacteraceae bacterium]
MKVLVVYYSLTGQAVTASSLAAEAIRESGSDVTMCRVDFADPAIRPKRPFTMGDVKRWSDCAANGELFPISYDPQSALSQRYDLIILFSNTWQHCPSPPIRSLLALPEFKNVLRGTPFAIYVVSRRLWEKNAGIVKQEGEAAGGRCIAVHHFGHHGGAISSLFTTVTYMLRSGDSVPWPLPKFGLSNDAVSRVKPATREVLAKVSTSVANVA